MRNWKIFYNNNFTFSSSDGIPSDAPSIGVLLIVQKGDDLDEWDYILHSSDFYKWNDNKWILSDNGLEGSLVDQKEWRQAKVEAINYAKL